MQERVREIYVDTAVVDYAVRLVTATRRTSSAGLSDLQRYISYGASPRASIALVTGARALAFLYSRDYVLPEDVGELALDVLRRRFSRRSSRAGFRRAAWSARGQSARASSWRSPAGRPGP